MIQLFSKHIGEKYYCVPRLHNVIFPFYIITGSKVILESEHNLVLSPDLKKHILTFLERQLII